MSSSSKQTMKGPFFLILGDLNPFPDREITSALNFKQVFSKRGENTLDIITKNFFLWKSNFPSPFRQYQSSVAAPGTKDKPGTHTINGNRTRAQIPWF